MWTVPSPLTVPAAPGMGVTPASQFAVALYPTVTTCPALRWAPRSVTNVPILPWAGDTTMAAGGLPAHPPGHGDGVAPGCVGVAVGPGVGLARGVNVGSGGAVGIAAACCGDRRKGKLLSRKGATVGAMGASSK